MATWKDPEKVAEYVTRVGRLQARLEGEREVLDNLPDRIGRVLDLGCGDGRLLDVVLSAHPEVTSAVAVDSSEPMISRARERFAGDDRVLVLQGDLNDPIPDLGGFDAIVSGFAIHHLEHDRKRSLFAEVASALEPAGVFANLEVVECATPELQDEFYERIDRAGGDPEDVLAPVDDQLRWMREAGLSHVDCQWRWRGFALLVGREQNDPSSG